MAHQVRTLRAVVAMSRPSQLALITVVYLAGSGAARASGHLSIDAGLVALLALLAVAASVHLANEYADADTDVLTRRTPFSGGSGALTRSGLPRSVALGSAIGAVIVGIGGAVTAVWIGQMPLVALSLLVIGAVFGWLYSLPRTLALSRNGLGEVTNALLGGLLLPIYGFAVHAGTIPWWVVGAFAPFALVDYANVMATAWPDREADRAVGKLTLAARWPARRLQMAFVGSLLAAGLLMVGLTDRSVPVSVALASVMVIPLAAVATLQFTKSESPFWAVATMVALIAVQLVAWWSLPAGSWVGWGAA
jgi:1,4-dihydroxy-2-naphthoate polyprenyltransferase